MRQLQPRTVQINTNQDMAPRRDPMITTGQFRDTETRRTVLNRPVRNMTKKDSLPVTDIEQTELGRQMTSCSDQFVISILDVGSY